MAWFIVIRDRYGRICMVESISDGLETSQQQKCDCWTFCCEKEVQVTGWVRGADETCAFRLSLTLQYVMNSIQCR
jgi:hypothetical protein